MIVSYTTSSFGQMCRTIPSKNPNVYENTFTKGRSRCSNSTGEDCREGKREREGGGGERMNE